MTDKEIIQALECCRDCCCKQCETEPDFQDALDLINRQQAEIERLKKKNKIVDLNRRMALLEKQPLYDKIKTIKAEAIKEFAERLKQYLLLTKNGQMSVISFENIDYLVKEMVGDDK